MNKNKCCISECNKPARFPHANYCIKHTKYTHKTNRGNKRNRKPNPMSLYSNLSGIKTNE